MRITDKELKLIKQHCKVDHKSEDDLLKSYYEWAFIDISSAVTEDYENYIDWFKEQPIFKKAVYPLTCYYFENRTAYIERNINYAPNMVLSAVHKLRNAFYIKWEMKKDEV